MTAALIGASSVRQLEANVASLEGPELTEEEPREIDPYAISEPGTNLRAQSSES